MNDASRWPDFDPFTCRTLGEIDPARWLLRFSQARIAVVGDFFLDKYLLIDPALEEPSLETGRPAHQIVETRSSPGAAGTIVNNLVSLGAAKIYAVGFTGDDGHGYELRQALTANGVDVSRLVVDSRRFTPTYTKPMRKAEGGAVELDRLDILNRRPTDSALENQTIDGLYSILDDVDAVIVQDQVPDDQCGVVTERVRSRLCQIASENPRVLFFADSRFHIGRFQAMITKPNEAEAKRALGENTTGVIPLACRLASRTGRPVLLTLGAGGLLVADKENARRIPTVALEGPLDVTGAGDSVTAGAVLSLVTGADLDVAALIGNLTASITVQQLGTTGTATTSQILDRFAMWRRAYGVENPS